MRMDDDDIWDYGPRTMQVIEEDDDPQDTGLLDSNGTPLYRVRHKVPCGFHRFREH